MNLIVRLSAVVVSLSLALPGRALASCGCSSCPIDTSAHDEPHGGNLRLDVSLQYLNQDQPRVGQHKASVGEVPNPEHNEVSTIDRLWNFRADYDIDSRWGVGLWLPFISRTHDHIAVDSGENEHWGFAGVGDLTAQVRFSVLAREGPQSPSLNLTASGKFPTGRTGAHNSDELAEVTIQPGSGSYDFIGGVVYAWRPLFAGVSYRANTPGLQGYRLGDTFLANLGSSYPLARRLDLLGQVNLKVKRKDDKGETSEDTSFTGGNFLYLSPGLRWHWTDAFSNYVYMQIPIYQRVNQEQITSKYNALFGATYQFGPPADNP